MSDVQEYMNIYREKNGFYTVEELVVAVGKCNSVIDPYSILISRNVKIGINNVLYPGVRIVSDLNSVISIGNGNVFAPNTSIFCENSSNIVIADENSFINGTIGVKCNIKSGKITFAGRCRLDGYINIYGNCYFGIGSQILGTINVYDCDLMDGGDYTDSDPDNRAGLLKGIGTARKLRVEKGRVINGFGDFGQDEIELQSKYHPKK